MTDDHRPDYNSLLRSPYDPDPELDRVEGESDLDWRVPVLAAILGALVVGAYVIYALVAGPDDDEEEAVEATTTTSVVTVPVASNALPEGFVPASAEVGFRVENVSQVPNLQLAVSSAAVGGIDSSLVAPVDVAFWEIAADNRTMPMANQRSGNGSLGNHTVTFGFPDLPLSPEFLAFPAVGEFSVDETLQLEMGELPIEVVDHVVDMGADRVIIIESIVVGDGWGYLEWRAEGTTAKVDVIVEFSGTDDRGTDEIDPTLLTPGHLRPLRQFNPPPAFPPLYNHGYSDQLNRSGEPLSSVNEATGIEISITVTVPESIGDPIALPIPGSS